MTYVPDPIVAGLKRVKQEHVRAFRVAAGQYKCVSVSSRVLGPVASESEGRFRHTKREWHSIIATPLANGDIRILCQCPGGKYSQDAKGSSCCKHAIAVGSRILRNKQEHAEIVALFTYPKPLSIEEVFKGL